MIEIIPVSKDYRGGCLESSLSGLAGSAAVIFAIGVVIAPSWWICGGKISFMPFIALPLGSLIPWLGVGLVALTAAPFVPVDRRPGYVYIPMFILFAAGIGFVVCSYLGAFFGLEGADWRSRGLSGIKWTGVFAIAMLGWILFTNFYPDV